jgi:N-acylneuraminate cytidylyltransferase
MRIAIIPARGGSKRILRKNIKKFAGKPMITRSILAAQESGLFDHIVVSTDDEEIAEVSMSVGADVPFLRPRELADDYVATRPVVNHAILEVTKLYGSPVFVCCIYATAPFMRASDLQEGLRLLVTHQADFAFTVTSFAYPIQRALRLMPTRGLTMFYPEYKESRSQDLEDAYHDAGQFYWGTAEAFLANRSSFSESSVPIILPRHRVHDIDTEEDWRRAELMFKALESEGKLYSKQTS